MLGTAGGGDDSGGSSSSSLAAPVPEATTDLQQLLQPSVVQGPGTGMQLPVECFASQPASPNGDLTAAGSLKSMQGSSKGLVAPGSFQNPTQLLPCPCGAEETEQESPDAIERELQKLGCLPAADNCHASLVLPLQHSLPQHKTSDAAAWQLVNLLQHRVGQLEQQQAALLGRIDQLQDCLQQAQHNGRGGVH
jgi:hypothetical protein